MNYPSYCFVSVTTDGTKYVSVFEHNGRSGPTRYFIERVDGKIEEWTPYYQNSIELVQSHPIEHVQNNDIVYFNFPATVQITIRDHHLKIS